jgi:hypothetical protein
VSFNGGGLASEGQATVEKVTISGNNASNCGGGITASGDNLFVTACSMAGAINREVASIAALGLDPLRTVGTFSPVRPLRYTSPAIEAVGSETCPATDLLGNPRPIDGDSAGVARCDSGAAERTTPSYRTWLPLIER